MMKILQYSIARFEDYLRSMHDLFLSNIPKVASIRIEILIEVQTNQHTDIDYYFIKLITETWNQEHENHNIKNHNSFIR